MSITPFHLGAVARNILAGMQTSSQRGPRKSTPVFYWCWHKHKFENDGNDDDFGKKFITIYCVPQKT